MDFSGFKKIFSGDLLTDGLSKRIYATDASAYREIPTAIALPKDEDDLILLVQFAKKTGTPLIPRTAGTSLAGQVVGSGIIVDFSKYMNKILEVDEEEKWVRVQPGVIRDELNHHLKQYDLFFAPETSTANRAMIGGMLGNNSCGANSIVYGSTRDHVDSIRTILSDGTIAEFSELDQEELDEKLQGEENLLETRIYRHIKEKLSDKKTQKEIRNNYPKALIKRRNTGYGIDLLVNKKPFNPEGGQFSFIDLLAGSEGTLSLSSEIRLKLSELPPKRKVLICAHFDNLYQALAAAVIAMEYQPSACELMDHYILDCTKNNIQQSQNRFFVKGEPKAILVIEINHDRESVVEEQVQSLIEELKKEGLGSYFPIVKGAEMARVWELRKAGLGLLSNMPGDSKPVPVVEDTAVDVLDLPQYIREFNNLLKEKGLYSVHYAHAGAGELHLRPILNLKTPEGQKLFREILEDVSKLVKKYGGSLSGEHGDGRLRGEYISKMIGEKNYALLKEIKKTWDPKNIFNPGKIIDSPPMDTFLRYEAGQETREIKTHFDFSNTQGFIRAAEQCNGSGDCRKLPISGGTMCPSYMATRDEKDTTRARANALREFLSFPAGEKDGKHLKEVMDLCLSCKGCKSECPSNVDMAKLKAEWEQQSFDQKPPPFRAKLIAFMPNSLKMGMNLPWLANFFSQVPPFSWILKLILGFSLKRSIPKLASQSLYAWYNQNNPMKAVKKLGTLNFFIDEFSNTLDVDQGKAVISLLWRLGYGIKALPPMDSGRTMISKGFIKNAALIAETNINALHPLVSKASPLLGLEPSAILGFRDEYISLTRGGVQKKAREIAANTLTLEEFLAAEIDKGNLSEDSFKASRKTALVHGHCHQKALSSTDFTLKVLSLIPGLKIEEIKSGCCGMAGSFGYDSKKFNISQKIGELVLFPRIRKSSHKDLIVAGGTSCRHQIADGTGKKALHPGQVLFEYLK
jgi:FAD/FMN-containing dehydrogenase/Fe-S oxidoreductase